MGGRVPALIRALAEAEGLWLRANALALLALLALEACQQPHPSPPERVPAWPVVQGAVAGSALAWHVALTVGQGVLLCPLEAGEESFCRGLDALSLAELRAMDAGTWSPRSTFFLSAVQENTMPAALLADADYVERLVLGSKAFSEPAGEEEEGLRELLYLMVAPEALERGWKASPDPAALAAFIADHRDDDAFYERFNHYAPMGSCSQDNYPELAARVHAELALARGDLATFMDLQLRLESDRFARVAWSNFSEERRPTFSPSLARTGVDLERLLTGLVLSSPGRSRALNIARIARAVRELEMVEVMLPKLEALATRGDLDPYNRLRAAEVWRLSQLGPKPSPERVEDVKARGRRLALEPLSRALLEATR